VVDLGDEHLVAGREAGGERLGQHEAQRRHVGSERDLLRQAAEHVRHSGASGEDDLVGLFGRGEEAVCVAVVLDEVLAHGVEDALRGLRATRAVEVGDRLTIDGPRQGGELSAHPSDVEVCHLATPLSTRRLG